MINNKKIAYIIERNTLLVARAAIAIIHRPDSNSGRWKAYWSKSSSLQP